MHGWLTRPLEFAFNQGITVAATTICPTHTSHYRTVSYRYTPHTLLTSRHLS